jgi:hypothetical protein
LRASLAPEEGLIASSRRAYCPAVGVCATVQIAYGSRRSMSKRRIQVSEKVFPAIWALSTPERTTEDQILEHVLLELFARFIPTLRGEGKIYLFKGSGEIRP